MPFLPTALTVKRKFPKNFFAKLVILLLLICPETFAQRMMVFLKSDVFEIEKRQFYIFDIEDERTVKQLGEININGKKTQLVCVPDVRFEARNYLKKFMTSEANQIPVTFIIKEFYLQELPDKQLECTFSFDYTIGNRQIRNKTISLKNTVPFNQTPENVEQVIKGTLQKMLTTLQSTPLEVEQKKIEAATVYKPVSPYTDVSMSLIEGGYFRNGILGKVTHTNIRIVDATGTGLGISFGAQFPLEIMSDKRSEWTEANLLGGIDYYKRLSNNWFGNLALHLPIGLVFLEHKASFVIGLTAHQRIMLFRYEGVKFSLGAFQGVSTHPFMPFALGISGGIGIDYQR